MLELQLFLNHLSCKNYKNIHAVKDMNQAKTEMN